MTAYPPQPPGGYPPPPPPQGGFGPPGPQGTPPDNNLIWAILSTLCCCLPLGVVSIVKSTQVSGLWAQGQFAAAQQAADDAKKYAMWGAIAGVVVNVLSLVFLFATGAFSASVSGY